MPPRYWLYNWIQENKIETPDDAAKLLSSAQNLQNLQKNAEETSPEIGLTMTTSDSICMASGSDFSGELDCVTGSCRAKQIDQLFRRVWHYFDTVVISDANARGRVMRWKEISDKGKKYFYAHIALLICLQKIKADDLVVFVQKADSSKTTWKQDAQSAGYTWLVDRVDKLAAEFRKEARFAWETDAAVLGMLNAEAGINVSHPDLAGKTFIALDPSNLLVGKEVVAKALATSRILSGHSSKILRDLNLAKQLRTPIGATLGLFHRMLGPLGPKDRAAQVAFSLNLPVVDGVRIEDLLRLRADEKDVFLRFQHSLRRAIQERAKLENETRFEQVATEIQKDLIDPELNLIKSRLKAAQSTFARKSIVGVALGGLVSTVGLVLGVPPSLAIPAGTATSASLLGSAASKKLDDDSETGLSDMYFLWKAIGHDEH